MNYPETFQELIDCFKRLPGIGNKNAERLAYHILNMKKEDVDHFANTLQKAKVKIKHCTRCGNICEDELCEICKDSSRDQTMICVVENSKDIYAMEKMKEYKGLYHVLHGAVSIMDGIMIEDLNILSLLNRLENVQEIIIATNPTRNGETTALYLAKLLENKNIKVTRIANGLPIGSNLDYADEMTLLKSFEGRTKI